MHIRNKLKATLSKHKRRKEEVEREREGGKNVEEIIFSHMRLKCMYAIRYDLCLRYIVITARIYFTFLKPNVYQTFPTTLLCE